MAFDVARIRGLFPALGDGWIHFDGAAGMLVPEQVASAVSTAMRAPVSGPGGAFPASQRAETIVAAARRSVADLVGGHPDGVVLGPSASVLLGRLVDALSYRWTLGDEVVVSRLDEQANIAPWVRVAKRIGANVRWGEIDIENCELPAWQYENLVNARTKAVAITCASGSVGTRPDVPTVVEIAKRVGATVIVDATYAAPFVPLDLNALGADVVVLSAQAWGGPAVGALVFRDPELLEKLPSVSLEPGARGPARLELGPHAYPLLAGVVASVDYLAGLDDAAGGSRRERLLTSLGSAKSYHAGLLAQLSTELRSLRHVMVIGDAMRRIPVLAFTVADKKAAEVAEYLASQGLCAFADEGTSGLFAALGVGEVGGAVRIGLAHYSNVFEINQLVRVLEELG
ncbi:cysteine desulfurase-like protein [Prauserella marina]|uniref:Cysteine desulfurase family protein, VC1184 subfamily n=1 Tax=Prauserella marina TaxID=530584 RepID=A0A222VJA3_9PSEU|nr:cysteine desulfurase-like protein [Prauserella marina]ASR33791.1 cysteine desulfurase-like protein [Prauserella marina]PWV82368.1 cysteine desulfurase family protein (TIGR01976 family) [Prauserella marina]SDC67486.1 cysteine desulfurase family protein, VC1184 subfamily [Prauserella marina]